MPLLWSWFDSRVRDGFEEMNEGLKAAAEGELAGRLSGHEGAEEGVPRTTSPLLAPPKARTSGWLGRLLGNLGPIFAKGRHQAVSDWLDEHGDVVEIHVGGRTAFLVRRANFVRAVLE